MKLVTVEEMRLAEQTAVGERGATWEGLMERAGAAVAERVLSALGGREKAQGHRVCALAGPGNNGGDALVAARNLHDAGVSVWVYLWKRRTQGDPLGEALSKRGVAPVDCEDDSGEQALQEELARTDVVVDGLLGMGLGRPIEGQLLRIVQLINQAERPMVVAVDLPTGVHADTGQVMGAAVRADLTVTMSQPKRGLYEFPGAEYAGNVVVAEIGIPVDLFDGIPVELLDPNVLRLLLPLRPPDAHKGTFGRALIVAGSLYYTGAPYLAAMGAYRVGAGLVTLAPPRSIYPVLSSRCVETTFYPLVEGEAGAIGEDAVDLLAEVLDRYQVVVLGCGLGGEECTATFVRRFLGVRERGYTAGIGFLAREKGTSREWELPPLVIDADGLNALAGVPEWWTSLPVGGAVLTPHPGEMARLLVASQQEVLTSRVAITQRAARTWGQVVVFKGAHTVVAHPDGRVVVSPVATAALATAGTGDVLAGAIGGFVAQGVPLYEAAQLGVCVHGVAGEMVEAEIGTAGGVAGDVLDRLPRSLAQLRAGADGV